MKRTVLFTLLIAATILNMRAQGLYAGIKAGYGFSLAGGQVSNDYYNTAVNHLVIDQGYDNSSVQTTLQGSYGAGFTPALQVGYMITKNIGAELNMAYLAGNKYDSYSSTDLTSYYDTNGTSSHNINSQATKTGATSFYLNPALVFRLPMPGKIVPYAKIGMYLGLISGIKSEIVMSGSGTNSDGSTSSTSGSGSGTSVGKVNLGITASVGADYMLTPHFALFGELNIISASLALKNFEQSSTSTTTNSNGTSSVNDYKSSGDYSDEITTGPDDEVTTNTPVTGPGISYGSTSTTTHSDGHITSYTSINYTNGNTYYSSESKDVKQLNSSVYSPFSSIGFAIGVRYFFR